MMMLAYSAFACVATLVSIAALYDFKLMIIPNWISLVLIGSFVVFALLKELSLEAWLWHSGIALIVFCVGLTLFVLRIMGGGDVKLLAATSLWIGIEQILPYLFYVSLMGAVVAIIKMIGIALNTLRKGEKLQRVTLMKSEVAYGIAIAAGTLLVFPQTIWLS